MLSEDEMHELETLAHLEEKDFNNNTCDKSYIDLVMNAGKKTFKIITKLQKENNLLNNYVKENEIYKKNLFNYADKKDKQIDLMTEIFYKRFKAELLLEYGFENEEQLKQYFADLVERK